jgi:hypothetical protein
VPSATKPHAPSAPLPFDAAEQAMHEAVHAVSQQTPSAAKPLAHVAPLVAGRPFFARHAPAALHVVVPVQVSGSSALATATHAPVPAQVRQVPLHGPLQQ